MLQAQELYRTTGTDHFPEQIAIEVHYQNAFFDMTDEGLLAFSNFLFRVGGYVIVHRRDQKYGYCATELLLLRVSCGNRG